MGIRSKRSFLAIFATAALAVLPTLAGATEAEEARAANEQASRDVLQRLFTACPAARTALRASEGFATFSGVGGGPGSGVAKPTRTRIPVYMKFNSPEAGKRDLVFIFSTRDDFSRFVVKGATLGGAAEAAGEDCSQALSKGVRVIQLEGGKVVGGDVPSAHYSRASLN
jgi:hypothetical protein